MSNLISLIDALLELDAKGALVPHGIGGHARTLLQRCKDELNTRPAPAATDTGLVTVGYVTPGWLAKHCSAHTITAQPTPAWTEAVVTRSQAEAIIAVERAMRKTAEQRLAQSQDDLKQVRADNAALTVEIERLQKINAMIMGDDEAAPRYTTKRMKQEVERATQVMRGEASDREAYVRSLETQLAAARKALEEIASFTQTTDLCGGKNAPAPP
ncbi:hypothetical protein [Brucella pituitosa]|uniref:hypothetical protein n=1 Tax=Brucella pituitosa TaxID=571256 RepID=UPI000FE233B1|nr:hypothetical protein [Brucella pituitosa]